MHRSRGNRTVMVKALGTGNEAEKLLKELDKRHAELINRPHPNVVQVIGYTRHGENLFVVTERVSGGDFRVTKFPLVLTIEILLQVAQGVAYLHEHNRELSDLNTLLVDFEKGHFDEFTGGITVKVQAQSNLRKRDGPNSLSTLAGRWKHPFHFPHVPDADCGKIDAYKFGIACVEMITGQTIGEEILLSGKLPQLPHDCTGIKAVIEKCLSSQPPGFHQIVELLVIRRPHCMLEWKRYYLKRMEIKIAFTSPAAGIKISEENPQICQLIDNGGAEAFRHFLRACEKGKRSRRR